MVREVVAENDFEDSGRPLGCPGQLPDPAGEGTLPAVQAGNRRA